MKRAFRVCAVVVAVVISVSAAERRVVDGRDVKGKADKRFEDRNGSVAKKIAPERGVRTNVKVNKAFTDAARGGRVEKKPLTPPRGKDGAPPAAPPPGPKPKPPK